jgi:hypothetical protein
MISHFKPTILAAFAIMTLRTITATTSHAQNAAQKILIGDTKVTVLQSYKGTDTLSKPVQIDVHDFDIPSEVIAIDNSPAAHIMSHSPIAHIKGDTGQEQSPAAMSSRHISWWQSANAPIDARPKTSDTQSRA